MQPGLLDRLGDQLRAISAQARTQQSIDYSILSRARKGSVHPFKLMLQKNIIPLRWLLKLDDCVD
jgi:hypothetical protein